MEKKNCTKCGELKELGLFDKQKAGKYGRTSKCKSCKSIIAKEYAAKNPDKIKEATYKQSIIRKESGYYKKYEEINKEKLKKYRTEYAEQNRAWIVEKKSEHYFKNKEKHLEISKKFAQENKEKVNGYKKKYKLNNKDKSNLQVRERRKVDHNFRIKSALRSRVYIALKAQNAKKVKHTMELIGCSPKFLYKYIESKFTQGMTWKNHKVDGWHIDHVIPCSSFDLTDPAQQLKCFHYTNLQPLWSTRDIAMSYGEDPEYVGNLEKADKII